MEIRGKIGWDFCARNDRAKRVFNTFVENSVEMTLQKTLTMGKETT
jgi:hypothetical protein